MEASQINAINHAGQTPLHTTAANGAASAVLALMQLGANRSAQDKQGRTALHLAAHNGHDDVVELLLQDIPRGSRTYYRDLLISLHQPDEDGRTPLHLAVNNGHDKILQTMMHAILSSTDTSQLLQLRPRDWPPEIVEKVFIKMNLVRAKDNERQTALHLAARKGYATVVDNLLSINPYMVNEQDNFERTALDYAAEKSEEERNNQVIKSLVERGATIAQLNPKTIAGLNSNGAEGVIQRAVENHETAMLMASLAQDVDSKMAITE
ncbi:ankyrin repeat-containing domain protein [Nemania sp. FL0916]|nr:ankyrin repeat-containing domain protein [Nemania sp. FL0916]